MTVDHLKRVRSFRVAIRPALQHNIILSKVSKTVTVYKGIKKIFSKSYFPVVDRDTSIEEGYAKSRRTTVEK
jgi:hypothetical protein